MLRKNFLSTITYWLSRKSKHLVKVTYYSTLISDNSHVYCEETKHINNIQIKENAKKVKLKVAKNKVASILDNKDLLDIIDKMQNFNPNITNSLTHFINKCKTRKDGLYLIDKNTAVEYVSLIIEDLSKNMCFLAEINPGFGILTTELLKAGVPLIHLYEANKELYPILHMMQNIYPDKLNLREINFLKIASYWYADKTLGGNRMQKILQGVKSKKWEDETYMQIIGGVSSKNFYGHLIHSVIFRCGIMSFGRPVFYLASPPSLWHKLTCDGNNKALYTWTKILFQNIFNYKILGTLNRKAFLPMTKIKSKRINNFMKEDKEYVFVIKLEPKADLYSQLSQEDWIIFWYFLKLYMQKRSNKVIPTLEKWIPGCGVRLIAKDYTIFTEFGDLRPIQILELFKELKSWPEYNDSSFIASMNDYFTIYTELQILQFNDNDTKMDE